MTTTTAQLDLSISPLDRTMPVVIRGLITENNWNDLVERAETAVMPMRNQNKTAFIGMMLTFLVVAIVFVSTINRQPSRISIAFILVPVIILPSMLWTFIRSYRIQQRAITDLRDMCEEESRRNTDLSFRLRTGSNGYYDHDNGDRRNSDSLYIEISISGDNVQEATAVPELSGAATDVFPTASYVPPTVVDEEDIPLVAADEIVETNNPPAAISPAQRLQELEQVRHLLSETEYQEKREEILAKL